MTEKCARCNEEGDDLRTLWMACFYEMNELNIPFDKKQIIENGNFTHYFYTLRVCKDCRSEWMAAISNWFKKPIKRESCGSGIFIRRNGANIEVTEEELEEICPGQIPVRFLSEDV